MCEGVCSKTYAAAKSTRCAVGENVGPSEGGNLLAYCIRFPVDIDAFLVGIAAFVVTQASIAFVVVFAIQGIHDAHATIGGDGAFVNTRLEGCVRRQCAFEIGIHERFIAFLCRIAALVFARAAIAIPIVAVIRSAGRAVCAIHGGRARLGTGREGRAGDRGTNVIRFHVRIGAFLRRVASFVFADSGIAFVIVGIQNRKIAGIRTVSRRRAREMTRGRNHDIAAAGTAAAAASRAAAAASGTSASGTSAAG